MRWAEPVLRLFLLLFAIGLAAPAAAERADIARVTRDVARIHVTPGGREVGRLRRDERVMVLRVTKRRDSGVWVRVRLPGPDRRRGWMRGRALTRVAPEGGRLRTMRGLDPFAGRGGNKPAWLSDAPIWGHGKPLDILNMRFECDAGGRRGYFEDCDVMTRVRVPAAARLGDAPTARIRCEVAVRVTGVTGARFRATAGNSVRAPLADRSSRASVTLSYDFREAARSAMINAQRCAATAGRSYPGG